MKIMLVCKLCGFSAQTPQASQKSRGPKNNFGIPLSNTANSSWIQFMLFCKGVRQICCGPSPLPKTPTHPSLRGVMGGGGGWGDMEGGTAESRSKTHRHQYELNP